MTRGTKNRERKEGEKRKCRERKENGKSKRRGNRRRMGWERYLWKVLGWVSLKTLK